MPVHMTAISIFSALFIAWLACQLPWFKYLRHRESRYVTLDGLRGFLALGVFFTHFVLTYYWSHTGEWRYIPEIFYRNTGTVGVAIFFMITGFLFVTKLKESCLKTSWIELYISRFYRIYPLYIISILIMSIIVFTSTKDSEIVNKYNLLYEYFKWVLFSGGEINGFEDTRLINAGVDWSLKYEWLFYLTLPLVSIFLRISSFWLAFSLFSLLIYFSINPIFIGPINTKYLVLFALGGLTSTIEDYFKKRKINTEGALSSVVVIFGLTLSLLFFQNLDFHHILAIYLSFNLIVLGNSIFGILKLRAAILLGELSYSIYLLHGILLYLVFTHWKLVDIRLLEIEAYQGFMPVISVLIVLVSMATYLLIEKKSIDCGNAVRKNYRMFLKNKDYKSNQLFEMSNQATSDKKIE